jgi:hypothetical protein
LTILEEIRLGISEESVPFDFRTAYLDSELPLAQSWRQTVVESAVALTPIRDNRVVIQYRFSGSAPATEHSPFLSRDNTETHTWHGIITHSFKKMELSVSYERVTAQSSTDFLHDATTFGEFNLSGVKSEEAMLRCSFPSSVDEDGSAIHGGYRILDGTLVGDLQSWPFFSVLQSVITNRIYYRLGGSVEYWQAGITHTWRIAPFSVRPAVTYYDVKPNLGIQTWQPLFLTVGVSSFADNQLDVVHAGLAQLEVAVRTELAGISAELYATQFLPLFQTRRAVQGGTGGAPSAPVAEGPATTTGGRWVTLTVRTQL